MKGKSSKGVRKPRKSTKKQEPVKADAPIKKRGRRSKKADVTLTVSGTSTKSQEFDLETHPVYKAAQWLEKNIPDFELSYHKKDANRHSRTVTLNIVAHILGYFNIQDEEFKRVVKNHNIVNVNN